MCLLWSKEGREGGTVQLGLRYRNQASENPPQVGHPAYSQEGYNWVGVMWIPTRRGVACFLPCILGPGQCGVAFIIQHIDVLTYP